MYALVTGASSGIGKEIAIYLSKLGYNLILVARSKDKLEELSKILNTESIVKVKDLSKKEEIESLIEELKDIKIDILVNNAGFGLFGEYLNVSREKEVKLIDTNINALEILMRHYLNEFIKEDKGYILNVASSASFMPGGPLMSSYYASKAYVRSLSLAVYEELRRKGSNVHISVLCPGPVDTNFNNVAGVHFSVKPLTAEYVAKYSIDKMFKNKLEIVPGFSMKLGKFFERFVSDKNLLKITYNIQKSKK